MSSMEPNSSATERQAPARRTLFSTLAATAVAAVLVLAACEGDNLFSGGSAGRVGAGAPKVGSVTPTPSPVAEGQPLDVRVKAIAPSGMDKITVRFRRAVSDVREIAVTGNRTDTVTVDVSIAIPAPVSDSIVLIEAFATDKAGRVSEVVSTTVRVQSRTAPQVSVSVTPSGSISVGDTLRIRVSARDNFGLSSIGYMVLNARGDTIHGPTVVGSSGVARDTTFTVVLPAGITAGSVQVVGIAINTQQLRGVSSPLSLSLVDRQKPTVRILTPQSNQPYPLLDSLLVRVHVVDTGGIAEVRLRGIAIRGDSLQNSVVVDRYMERVVPFPQPPSTVLPTDTVIQRFLVPVRTDSTSERVFIIATARDASGNVSADTLGIIDGPRIVVVTPQGGSFVGLNSILPVRITASDRVTGLDSVKLVLSGVQQQTFTLRNLAPATVLDTVIPVPIGSQPGTLTITPGVWNRGGVGGFSQPVQLTVASSVVSDTVLPRVLRTVQVNERVEFDDSIRVTVRATDGSGSGIQRMGVVMQIIPEGTALPMQTIVRTTGVFNPPLSGTPERVFELMLDEVYDVTDAPLPRRFTLQVHAFAVDAAGNCGASAQSQLMAAPCETVTVDGVTYFTARGQAPPQLTVTGVVGQSSMLPSRGRIADLAVDGRRRRVYLSDIDNYKVEIFNLRTSAFDLTGPEAGGNGSGRGLVGAAPWGLMIGRGLRPGDSPEDSTWLYVANSGGTNISVLPLDGSDYMYERLDRRIFIPPQAPLLDVTVQLGENNRKRYEVAFGGNEAGRLSDRPQYIAQHKSGVVVFTTRPTNTAPGGTIRYADVTTARPEVYMYHGASVTSAENTVALANLDSAIVVRNLDTDDQIILYDHKAGTTQQISAGPLQIDSAVAEIKSLGSDVVRFAGRWNSEKFRLTDTTYLATSTNRDLIAIGEGPRGGTRIFLCCSIQGTAPLEIGLYSTPNEVTDLVNQAAETVLGLGLNYDGSFGVARGASRAYYFSNDRSVTFSALRLQGEVLAPANAGGAALHPEHRSVLQTGDLALSFVPTSGRTIKIIDSTHFYQRGEIFLRDNVVGTIKALLPLPEENMANGVALSSTDPNFIVMKLVAVTEGANFVVVNVLRRDVLP